MKKITIITGSLASGKTTKALQMINGMSMLFGDKGAAFSMCGKYRYALWRIWDDTMPLVMFIGLNPSTANEYSNDPTIRRVMTMASKWGYGGVYMTNCFPYISTNPDDLSDFGNTSINDDWLRDVAKKCKSVVFAWGSFEVAKQRAAELSQMFPDALALIINQDGSPRHPLYVPGDVKPIKFNQKTHH